MENDLSYEELLQRVEALEIEAAKSRNAEESLRASEKRLSDIVDGNAIPTIVMNERHIVTHWNRAIENLTGISADEMIGTRKLSVPFYTAERTVLADLIVDDASEEEIARYYGAKGRKSAVIEGAYEAEDFFPDLGENGKWLFFTAAPLRDAKGKITGAIETLQDITDRTLAWEALRESEERFRTLLDFAPYAIVVFTLDGKVQYLNPAFTEVFGWTLDELEGQRIPYVPPGLEKETESNIQKLFQEKVILRYETKRFTKDGRILDVVMRAAIFSDPKGKPAGELLTIRDVTREKRMARNNEAMLRISMALPRYPDLEDLLDYINSEIKTLLDTEGATVTLLDEERRELFFLGVVYDNTETQKRVKEVRFPVEQMDQIVVPKVIRDGEPVIVSDTSKVPKSYPLRDQKLGYVTKNFVQVPVKSSDRIIGVLTAINKKEGTFEQTDVELLSMIGTAVALSIENAKYSEELKTAYREMSSLNRAKDKIFHHLSHELKTPVSVLSGSLNILTRKLKTLPEPSWKPAMERAQRNLDRITGIQYEVEDIIKERDYKVRDLLSLMLDQCSDELETLVAEEVGEAPVVKRIRDRIDGLFGPRKMISEEIPLDGFVAGRLEDLNSLFSHREVEISLLLEPAPLVHMPRDPLQKLVDGLIKNAIENTPDEGKIEIVVRTEGEGTEFAVKDYGVGITEENQRRIFEGFFATQDTMSYSSKRPFDFDAGGKGADLLRMRIFSERYRFKINMASSRCRFIPKETDVCPGKISQCRHCREAKDCYGSGGTTFSVYFSPARG